jgi:hypothetical protein
LNRKGRWSGLALRATLRPYLASSMVRLVGPLITLMMEAETVPGMLDHNSILTRMIAREDLIAFSRRESFILT